MSDPFLQKTIKGYLLTEIIGEGGMGRVYKAVHTKIGKTIAVKVLLKDGTKDQRLVQRFFTEAKAVNEIRHENVVDVLDLDETPEGEHFLLMEYLEGSTLSRLMHSEAPFTTERVAKIGIQICSALHAAHTKGIIHRDLKGDNIFITTRGDNHNFVKILDFGIAKLTYGNASMTTKTGAVVGTPLTMSPEQARGEVVDALSDIYSLGVILHQMATGEPPFFDENPFVIVGMHMNVPVKPLKERNPAISDALAAVILRCLEKDKRSRFVSMKAVAAALAECASLSTTTIETWSDFAVQLPEVPTTNTPVEKTKQLPTPTKAVERSDVTGESLAQPKSSAVFLKVIGGFGVLAAFAYLFLLGTTPTSPIQETPAKPKEIPTTPVSSTQDTKPTPASVPTTVTATSSSAPTSQSQPAKETKTPKIKTPKTKTIDFDIDPFKK